VTIDQLMLWAGPILSAVIGWFLRELWAAVKELRSDLRELERDFVRKDDYRSDINRVHELLDKIYEKIDAKADR